MRCVQPSVFRLVVVACLGANYLAASNSANAQCAGTLNTCYGAGTLVSVTSGQEDTAMGADALDENTTGTSITASGVAALYSNTTGFYNTAEGYAALRYSTTGYRNVALGWQAGIGVTTGSDNIIIGAGTQGNAADIGVIRIGSGTYQKKAFVAGIREKTTVRRRQRVH